MRELPHPPTPLSGTSQYRQTLRRYQWSQSHGLQTVLEPPWERSHQRDNDTQLLPSNTEAPCLPQKYRVDEVRKQLWSSPSPTLLLRAGLRKAGCPGPRQIGFLNISIASLSNLCQRFTTLTAERFLLTCKRSFPCFSLCLWPPARSLATTEKSWLLFALPTLHQALMHMGKAPSESRPFPRANTPGSIRAHHHRFQARTRVSGPIPSILLHKLLYLLAVPALALCQAHSSPVACIGPSSKTA